MCDTYFATTTFYNLTNQYDPYSASFLNIFQYNLYLWRSMFPRSGSESGFFSFFGNTSSLFNFIIPPPLFHFLYGRIYSLSFYARVV